MVDFPLDQKRLDQIERRSWKVFEALEVGWHISNDPVMVLSDGIEDFLVRFLDIHGTFRCAPVTMSAV